jgi:hypothetical protein
LIKTAESASTLLERHPMKIMTGIITGLILGYLAEPLLARLLHKAQIKRLKRKKLSWADAETTHLRQKMADYGWLHNKLAAAEAEIANLRTLIADHDFVREQLAAAEAEIDLLRIQLTDDQK